MLTIDNPYQCTYDPNAKDPRKRAIQNKNKDDDQVHCFRVCITITDPNLPYQCTDQLILWEDQAEQLLGVDPQTYAHYSVQQKELHIKRLQNTMWNISCKNKFDKDKNEIKMNVVHLQSLSE